MDRIKACTLAVGISFAAAGNILTGLRIEVPIVLQVVVIDYFILTHASLNYFNLISCNELIWSYKMPLYRLITPRVIYTNIYIRSISIICNGWKLTFRVAALIMISSTIEASTWYFSPTRRSRRDWRICKGCFQTKISCVAFQG